MSERIDVNKTNESKECDICIVGIFYIKGSNFNGCHDVLMMSMILRNIPI